MPRTILPNFATLSEFISGLNGDCGPTATLSALNFVNPQKWPLTAAGLKALDADEIAGGFAESNGAQNIPSMSNYLDKLKIQHHVCGYAQFTIDLLHTDLKNCAGHKPVIVEWSLAGNLPGDEAGVHFHFSTCGGIDTGRAGDGVGGGYFWCDGDNRADDQSGAPRFPVMYTWQQIMVAAPVAYIVINESPPVAPPPPPPVNWEAKYNALKAAISAVLGAN